MSDDRYLPIDCSLHDRLEAAATLGRPVTVRYRMPGSEVEEKEERIVDVLTRQGAEYLRLASGLELRLDRILAVDGVRFRPDEPR